MMDEITLEDVNGAIKKYMRPDKLVIAIVCDDGKGMAEALASGKPSPMSYGELAKPAEILAEDKEIEKFPLNLSAERIQVIPVSEMFQR